MRTSAPRLLPFFRSEAQLRLLALIFLHGDRPWSTEQIEAAVEAPATTAHRELHRALDAGLLVRDESVRPHAYRAATDSPAYEPLKALLASTVGLESELSELLDEAPGVRAAVIHGSWVDGRLRPDSDVDVLVVGEVDLAELRRRARPIGRRAGRRIDLTAFRPDEFRRELDAGNGFLRKIVDSPVEPLVGDLEAQR
jgi:predicted nucleotidyltransferase